MKSDDIDAMMANNIDKILNRGERFEELRYNSEELSTVSRQFHKSAAKSKSSGFGLPTFHLPSLPSIHMPTFLFGAKSAGCIV